MQQKLLFVKHTSIKQLLAGCLKSATNVYTSNSEILDIESKKIPLYKGRGDGKFLYISGVALWLAKFYHLPSAEIAQVITTQLSTIRDGIFTVEQVFPGWIHIEITQLTIATWLQNLIETPNLGAQSGCGLYANELSFGKNLSIAFSVQHAYSRCYSLLQIAQQERLIELTSNTNSGNFMPVQPIPWLDSRQKLRLNHKSENHLIHQLVKIIDSYSGSDDDQAINWEKLAIELSQAFEDFWRHCRIWGEVKIKSPELSQSRLGLLIVTQLVIKTLLTQKMKVVPLWL